MNMHLAHMLPLMVVQLLPCQSHLPVCFFMERTPSSLQMLDTSLLRWPFNNILTDLLDLPAATYAAHL